MRIATVLMLMVAACPAAASAQSPAEEPTNRTRAIAEHWLKVSRDYAESFTLAPSKPGEQPYALFEKPVFRHTQSVRGDDIGAMHLWVLPDGRPAVIGVVFAWSNSDTSRTVSYEFHSLTDEPLTLRQGERQIWRSETPGIVWQEFPEPVQPPAAGALQQRVQANRLARGFSAETTTPDDQRWELRFVPTPIYQYKSADAGVTHGAMYVFCQGTDTEVILLIEAVAAGGGPRWRYVLLPFTDYKARVAYGEQQVWESPAGQLNENGKPHYWGFIGKSPKPEVETTP